MVKRVLLGCAALSLSGLFIFVDAGPASANAITLGDCKGSGVFENAGFTKNSVDLSPTDVVEVPQKDTVHWSGSEHDAALGSAGPARDISGEVQLDLPFPLPKVTIDKWGNNSIRYANEGEHKYDVPSFVVGIKMKLHGEHREGGSPVCAGSVFVRVKGSAVSNPIFWAGVALTTVAGGVFLFAGRPVFAKIRPAFEDINPG